ILSARMVPGESTGHVILMLGGHRFQAKVPANVPMGNVWLQVMNREIPAQFRLLSDFKAASLLAEMLAGKIKSMEHGGADIARAGKVSQDTGWQRLEQSQLPFQAEFGSDVHRLILHDQKDDSTRSVVNASSDEHGFLLHGRADLDHLGPVAFALQGSEETPWRLNLYVGRDANLAELRSAFMLWLEKQQEGEAPAERAHIEGKLINGRPEKFASFGNFHA
ncbi:MAG: hypothetical protein ACE5E3_00900, partial [Mariprofundus sp.]